MEYLSTQQAVNGSVRGGIRWKAYQNTNNFLWFQLIYFVPERNKYRGVGVCDATHPRTAARRVWRAGETIYFRNINLHGQFLYDGFH